MNTCVTIGSSQDFRLSRAILVYGTSSYDGYPYRHPFLTMHEVIHDSQGVRLAEAKLVTPNLLMDLMTSLGKDLPVELLPERVLVRTTETIVWWMPSGERTMFFSDRGGDPVLKTMNGKRYPQPPLLFKASGSHLWIRALGRNKRPTASSKLYLAPYWNVYSTGICCNGTMAIPQEKPVTAIDIWEKSFFQSEFTHAAGVRKHTHFAGGILAMWASLDGKRKFPTRYLVERKQTLNEFITNHDSSYRNEP